MVETMASEKDICIYALQHIGQFADMVSLDEDSQHAAVAKKAYPFVRDAMLERHTWNFALTTKRIARIVTDDDVTAFPLPEDCLLVSEVKSGTEYERFNAGDAWEVQLVGDTRCVVLTDVWRRDVGEITVRYVKRVTNTATFSAGFTEALSWNLAAAVAGPIIKDDTGITVTQKLVQYAQAFEAKAALADAAQRKSRNKQPLAPWHVPGMFFYSRTERRYPTPTDERGDFEV